MSKKTKGLSFEEKRKRLSEIFYETKDFFTLKELEKIAPKQKGIVVQSVKEVLESLVSDNLVDTEKIGTSVYFWAFPSKAANNRKRQIQELGEQVETEGGKLKQLKKSIEEAQAGREETDERKELAEALEKAEKEEKDQIAELAMFKENDPEVLNTKRAQAEMALKSANRWTDNIFAIQQYCVGTFGVSTSEFSSNFEIPENLDYVS